MRKEPLWAGPAHRVRSSTTWPGSNNARRLAAISAIRDWSGYVEGTCDLSSVIGASWSEVWRGAPGGTTPPALIPTGTRMAVEKVLAWVYAFNSVWVEDC